MSRIIDLIFGEARSEKGKKKPVKKTYNNIIEVVIVYTKRGETQVMLIDDNNNEIDLGHVEYWTIEDWSKVGKIHGGDDFVAGEAGETIIIAREDTPFTVVYENPGSCEVEQRPFVIEAIKLTIK
jgi:hypothetical protein